MSEVEWRPVAEFPRLEVSSEGRVRGAYTKIERRTRLSNSGYLCLNVEIGGKRFSRFVHRMVAAAFCLKPGGATVVNHLDGNRQNNHCSNLQWCTPRENALHAVHQIKTLTPPVWRGTANSQHRAVVQIEPTSGDETLFETMTAAAATGFDIRGIYAVCSGEQRTHYGYRWRYASAPRTKSHNRAGANA